MKKGFGWIGGVGILAMLVAPVCGEDWVKLAAETDEPAFGMRIEAVVPGSQAESIGLKPGDTIYQMGDHAMRGFVVRSRPAKKPSSSAVAERKVPLRSGRERSASTMSSRFGPSLPT